MRTTERACAVLVALVVAAGLFGGCQDEPKAHDGTTKVKPEVPSDYMDEAVLRYNTLTAEGQLPWKPVQSRGRVWKGDPHVYEHVCGATFLAQDGTVPKLDARPDGSEVTQSSQETWYHWLQRHPSKWAAFNAWLGDPAVRAAISDGIDNIDAGRGYRQRRLGDSTACKDADEAGTPTG